MNTHSHEILHKNINIFLIPINIKSNSLDKKKPIMTVQKTCKNVSHFQNLGLPSTCLQNFNLSKVFVMIRNRKSIVTKFKSNFKRWPYAWFKECVGTVINNSK